MTDRKKKGYVVWFTGLPSSGKTTLARELSKSLEAKGAAVIILDGDQLRSGIHADLGFSDNDRSENVRRTAEAASLLLRSENIVLVALVSPFERDRQIARNIVGEQFYEVFVDCPLDVCEKRDVKGLYKKARRGEVKAMTGIDSRYEIPVHPDLLLRTDLKSISECVELLLSSPNLGKLF